LIETFPAVFAVSGDPNSFKAGQRYLLRSCGLPGLDARAYFTIVNVHALVGALNPLIVRIL
jgi:hypothetical protein